jgi:mRNA interferase RelE/StbE
VTYRIELRPAAAKALRKLDKQAQRRVQGALALLAENPRPPAARPLVGRPAWRVRTGDYRIIYQIEDRVLLVVVVALGHRREVYRT